MTAVSRETASDYINEPYIILSSDIYYAPHQHAELFHPYLEGVRLLTNVQVVVAPPDAIWGSIKHGRVTAQ